MAVENEILLSLDEPERAALEQVARRQEFPPDSLILKRGPIERCLFIESGIVSLLYEAPGASPIGIGLVGRDGMLGVSAILGIDIAEHCALTSSACTALSVSAADLRRMLAEFPRMRGALLRYANLRMGYGMRTAACHLTHRLDQRLASWILRATELLKSQQLAVTHRHLALLLGVTRASTTLSVHELEGQQAIWSRRNLLVVRDRERLEALSCGCYSPRAAHDLGSAARRDRSGQGATGASAKGVTEGSLRGPDRRLRGGRRR